MSTAAIPTPPVAPVLPQGHPPDALCRYRCRWLDGPIWKLRAEVL